MVKARAFCGGDCGLAHTLITTLDNNGGKDFTALVDNSFNNDLSTTLATICGLYEVARITHRILEGEGYGNATLNTLILPSIIATLALFITTLTGALGILQTALISLSVGSHTGFDSLCIRVKLRGVCATVIGEIFVE